MPSSRDIRAGGAYVEFSLRRRGLERSLRAVGRRLQRFGGNVQRVGLRIAALGGVITAPFAVAVRTFAKVGDDLEKMARRTGVSVEALSELGFAAQQSGTDLGTLERGIKTAQRNIIDLGRGLSTQKDAFDALGLSFEQLDGLSPERQFTTIAEALSKIEDPTERAARSMVIFGRAGQQLIPLLAGGERGIEALRQEARNLGLTIDTDTAQKAAAFTDALGRLRSQAKVAAVNVGAALAPAIIRLSRHLTVAGKAAIDFVKKNKSIIVTVAAVGAALAAAGVAVAALGAGIILTGVVLVKLAAIVSFLLSPLGLAVIAIGAATVALLKFTNLGGQAAEFLRAKFGTLTAVVQRTFTGIRDAVEGNDIKLAIRILWVNIRLAFLEGTQGLRNIWLDFKASFLKASEEAGSGTVAILNNAFAGMQRIAVNLGAAFGRAFVNLVGDAREAFNLAVLLAKQAGAAIRFAIDPTFSADDRSAASARAEQEFVAQQQADQKTRRARLTAIQTLQNLALAGIERERSARQQAIEESLAVELAAIQTAADADKARIQERIDALKAERRELEQRAVIARNARRFADQVRNFFRGPLAADGTGFDVDPTAAVAGGLQQAAIAARGVTSSFDIRSVQGPKTLENNVQQIDRKAERMLRHLQGIDNNLKPGVQPGGLAIT